MKKFIILFVILLSFNGYAIPTKYNSTKKQTIYEYVKDKNNKEALIGYISLFRDSAIRNKSGQKVLLKYNLVIYYLSVFDLENSNDELDTIMLNSIDSLKMFTNEGYNICINIGRRAYNTY